MAFGFGDEGIKIRIGADLGPFKRAISQIEQTVGKNIGRFGLDLSRRLTLPLAAIGTASVKAAIDFESAFAGVRKTVDATEEEFAALRKGIQEMSRKLPASANEIAGVAEAAGQLGIQTDNILEFSRTMIDLGETTNLSAHQAATALARFANVTGMSQRDFDRLGSAIVDLGNNFATTEAEIVEMALRLAGSGKQIGLTQAEILAFATALSSVGVEAEAGGSAFSKLFARIAGAVSKGGSQLQSFSRVANLSATDFAEKFRTDAAGAITAFVEGLGNISQSGGDTLKVLDELGITEIRMRDALLRSANAAGILSDAIGTSNRAWRENNALSKEAQQRYDTVAARLEVVRNKLTAAAVVIGEDLLPFVEAAADAVGDLADAFSELDAPTRRIVVTLGSLTAVIGPLTFTIGKLAGALKVIGAGFRVLTGPIGVITGMVTTLLLHFREMSKIQGVTIRGIVGAGGPAPLTKDVIRQVQHLQEVREAAEEARRSISRMQFESNLQAAGLELGSATLVAQANLALLGKSAEDAAAKAKAAFAEFREELLDAAIEDFEFHFTPPEDVLQSLQDILDLQGDVAYSFEEQAARRIARLKEIARVQRESFQAGLVEPTLPESDLEETIAGLQRLATVEQFVRDLGEDLGGVMSDAFGSITQAIGDSIAGFESFGRAVKRIMRGVLADIIAVIAKTVILKGVMAVFGVAPGDGSFGGSVAGALVGSSASPGVPAPQINLTIRPSISMGELQFHLDQHNQTQL